MLKFHQVSAPNSRFVRACRALPVDSTPVWFMRQAGRYMAEYRAIRKDHSILEICKSPRLAAEVTITAAEKLGVDAAIIFADLLLPLEPMGMKIQFLAGEGPAVTQPIRSARQIYTLKTDKAGELGYVAQSIQQVSKHFAERLPVIGFCGAPFTLASYMIEGGGSRSFAETKKLMYRDRAAWDALMQKLVAVLSEYATAQAFAGADALQVFDSWVGCLAPDDYREFVLPSTRQLIAQLRRTGVPIIYFGTDTAALLPLMRETGADVIGIDWRIPLDEAWQKLSYGCAIQGNLDPASLLADWKLVQRRAEDVLRRAQGRVGHIFNLGHGILPDTPVDNVRALADFVHEFTRQPAAASSGEAR